MSLNYVTFNQNYSHLAVGTSSGFRVYYTEPFAKCHETYEGNISLMEMLFSTSLIALVLSPRRLVITNTKRNSTICELTFPTSILGVKLNRKRLVVVLEDQIYLYDISNMKLIHTVDTSPNPHGVCALSPSSDKCYLAYPLPQRATPSAFTPPSHVPPSAPHMSMTNGHVLILDALSRQAVNVIEAHRAPLSCITMNHDGTRLATASDKGTIIRVFAIPDGRKLFQFRRGSMPARIFSMSFNQSSTMLCVSSATETVHIFRLSSNTDTQPQSTTTTTTTTNTRETLTRRKSDRSPSPSNNNDDAHSDSFEASEMVDPSSSSSSSNQQRKHNGTFAGMIRRTSQNVTKSFAATVGGYLPTAVSEMLEPARDFAWFKVPKVSGGGGGGGAAASSSSGFARTVVAMCGETPQVMVVTAEGQFLVFDVDVEKGGEAVLTQQYSVLASGGRPSRSMSED